MTAQAKRSTFADTYRTLSKTLSVVELKQTIENRPNNWNEEINGVCWHIMGDMSAVSLSDQGELTVVEHIHLVDGYESRNHAPLN